MLGAHHAPTRGWVGVKARCKICRKEIEALNEAQLKALLAQHMLTHPRLLEMLLSMAEWEVEA